MSHARPALLLFLLSMAAAVANADVTQCKCDPAVPASMEARECSLCREADKHDSGEPFFILKDNNPRKPNRWLILPRKHYTAGHSIDEMPASDYRAFWAAAIAKSKELFGDLWGVAYNGEQVRTQCHGHIHIGKFITAVEGGKPITITNVSQIPRSRGKGMWIHGVGKGRMHVHWGEQICETALVR